MTKQEADMKVERYLSKYKLLSIPCPYNLIVRQNSCDSDGNIKEDDYTIWLECVDFDYIFKNFDKNIGTIEFIIPNIDIQYLFQGCINLKRVILRNIIVRNIDRVINIFNICNNIQEVIIDNVYMLKPSRKSKKLKDLIEADVTKHCDSGIELQRSRELLSKIKEQYSQEVSVEDVKKYSQIQLYNKCLNLE